MSKQKKEIRLKFRNECLKRDGFKCVFCDFNDIQKLDVHHITDRHLFKNGGYVKENGITLCPAHHLEAEEYHISKGASYVNGLHPNDLYDLIHSNYTLSQMKDSLL